MVTPERQDALTAADPDDEPAFVKTTRTVPVSA